MINKLEFNTVLTKELDEKLVQGAVTGFMVDNALRAKFVGAKTVLIPEVEMSALGDYDRDSGFTRGTITVSNTPFTMSRDRSASFQLDAEDRDETGLSEELGHHSSRFVKEKVVPEVDAYVLSKLASTAVTREQTVTGDPATKVYGMIMEAAGKVYNEAGYDVELVAFVDSKIWAALTTTTEVVRQLVTSDFKKGDVNTAVKTLNGIAILPVPDIRMKTAYVFKDGKTEGQTEGGFAPMESAKNIGLLVMPKHAASLVKKTEKTRLFTPENNLDADAWKVDYRIYYDVFVKNSMLPTIYTYVY